MAQPYQRQALTEAQARLVDEVVADVTTEYKLGAQDRELVRTLVAHCLRTGERIDAPLVPYDSKWKHLVANGTMFADDGRLGLNCIQPDFRVVPSADKRWQIDL